MNHPNEKESTSFDRITPIDLSFSPVVEDAPYRWLRSLGLNPRQGQGLVQRAIGVAPFAWLPIVIWAWFHNRLLGIPISCLVAIPLLILGEGVVLTEGEESGGISGWDLHAWECYRGLDKP